MIYHFDELSSTNDQAQSDLYSDGDIVVAERQSAGRGQRGNKWLSGEGLNLTLSAVVEPKDIEVRQQFLVLQASALAICDALRSFGLQPKIKWTNDIYIGDEKIVGILIENRLSGSHLVRSVVGIGLNVNQLEFDPSLPNPTSMALVAQREFDREDVLEALSAALNDRFAMLASGDRGRIAEDYHALIYRRDQWAEYRPLASEKRLGRIEGVRPSGELMIEWEDGSRGEYLFGSIDFVIDKRKR